LDLTVVLVTEPLGFVVVVLGLVDRRVVGLAVVVVTPPLPFVVVVERGFVAAGTFFFDGPLPLVVVGDAFVVDGGMVDGGMVGGDFVVGGRDRDRPLFFDGPRVVEVVPRGLVVDVAVVVVTPVGGAPTVVGGPRLAWGPRRPCLARVVGGNCSAFVVEVVALARVVR
jgi:hypothetical protein